MAPRWPRSRAAFWTRALPRHDWFLTGLHLGLFGVTVFLGLSFYRSAARTLRHEQPKPTSKKWYRRALMDVWASLRVRGITGHVSRALAVVMTLLVLGSFAAINWWWDHDVVALGPWFYRSYAESVNGDLRGAVLNGADLSGAILRWASLDLDVVSRVHGDRAGCLDQFGFHQSPATTEDFVLFCEIRVYGSDGRIIPPDSIPARLAAYRASQGNQ